MVYYPKKKTFYRVIVSSLLLMGITIVLLLTNHMKQYSNSYFSKQESAPILNLRNLQVSDDNQDQQQQKKIEQNQISDLQQNDEQLTLQQTQSSINEDHIQEKIFSEKVENQELDLIIDGETTEQEQENNQGEQCPEKGTESTLMVLFYSFLIFYMILGLAVICDDFFVPALDQIGMQWDLSPDVVGATLMAIGGDAPEFFTGIIGTFKQSDVGSGTIVGSLTFNLFFVMGACVLFTNQTLKLSWYPFARDSIFYIVSLIVLILCAGYWSPNQIEWWESLLMIGIYAVYIIYMMNNSKFEKQFTGTNASDDHFLIQQQLNELERQKPSLLQQKYSIPGQRPSVRSIARSIIDEEEQSTAGFIFSLIAKPLLFCFNLTVPHPLYKTWPCFIISTLEIGFMSYIMVFAAEKVGNALAIPEIVMGITILAAGTSITDLLTSFIVYKKGFGDMAMSSAFGSNIFDIIMCLPVPWLLYTLISGQPVQMQAGNLNESLIIILVMQFILMVIFRWQNQVLNRGMGYFMLAAYFLYLAHYLITTDWTC